MNTRNALTIIASLAIAPMALAGGASSIIGDYVEIRSCDVYTGPCFANGEMGLTGEEAILTWSVNQGTWEGVALDGMKVIAVVRASATLGDTSHNPYPAKAAVILDQNADATQRQALLRFAKHMAGKLLDNIVDVEAATIETDVAVASCGQDGCASVKAGNLIDIQTRCLGDKDHVCGNEELYYPPLTQIENARPAYTTVGIYDGDGLGVTFDDADRRSAYLGRFQQ
jgi:hypothetical protein